MHDAARNWMAGMRDKLYGYSTPEFVVDVGGRNVNYGTIRSLFSDARTYVAIDLYEGEGVDWVGDFLDYAPPEPVDLVVCMEVFEHAPMWRELVEHAASILAEAHGRLLCTAATTGRLPHSGIDGGPLRHGEWYQNVEAEDLMDTLARHFHTSSVSSHRGEPLALMDPDALGDVYGIGFQPKR